MSVSPALASPPSAGPPAELGQVRSAQPPSPPVSANSQTGENNHAPAAPAVAASPQDEVKLQWDTSDRIPIYQFVNENGSLILQVPSDAEISLARQISQELTQEAQRAPAAKAGGKDNGY